MLITVKTDHRTQLVNITRTVQSAVTDNGITQGLIHIFSMHTTAGITINESADPDVAKDILTVLDKMVPHKGGYRHREGNSAAHVKTSLMGSSDLVAVENGRLVLGTWQGIFFCEFDGPRTRKVLLKHLP